MWIKGVFYGNDYKTGKKKKINIKKYYLKVIKLCTIIALIIVWLYLTITLGKNNLSNPNFWYDESGQFWMAKGLNHFSPPLSEERGINEVIKQNSIYNMDPGGFTVLLHFWSKISSTPEWLRLLPYIFYILSCVSIGLLVYLWTRSFVLSLIFLNIMNIYKGSLWHFGFELRAFSMEYFGVIISLLFFEYYRRYRKDIFLFLTSISLGIFITSRYSFVVYAITIILLTLLLLKKEVFRKLSIFSPLLISIILTYFYSSRLQLSGLSSPSYTESFMLYGKSWKEIINIFNQNIFTYKTIAMTLFILFGSYMILKYKKINNIYKYVWLYILISQLLFMLLSVAGIHPWFIPSRWNLSSQMIVLISLAALTSVIYSLHYKRIEKFLKRIIIMTSVKDLILLTSLAGITFIVFFVKPLYREIKEKGHYFRHAGESTYSNIVAVGLKDKNVKYFVSYNSTPTVKYLYEFGPLKGDLNYPSNFLFETSDNYLSDKIIDGVEIFEYFIFTHTSASELNDYQKKLNLNLEDVSAYPPSYLLKKVE